MKRISSAVLFCAAALVLGMAGCTQPRHAKVTPTEGLLGGSEVAIEMTGYERSHDYVIWQCAVGRELTEGCTVDPLVKATTDSVGNFSTTAFVESSFVDQEGGVVDCTQPVACDITIHDPASGANVAFLHTEFAGHDGLSVHPDRDLTDGQTISVVGLFVGGGNKVMQCPSNVADYTACDPRTLQYVDHNGSGHFEVQMTVYATIQDDAGNTTDCTVPGACMVISDLNHGWSVEFPQWHPLEFD